MAPAARPGDPYFSHPLEVAAILTDLKLDDATIAAALLHDTIEDTDATRAEIDQLFGEDIGRLVEGLTKIEQLDLVSRKAAQAENLRKLLLAISEDVRVLLVKLADRLHNMRTLEYMPEDERKRIAEETLEIYAPLAGRMGMQDMRDELEELAFRVVKPDAYDTITERLAELREPQSQADRRHRGRAHGSSSPKAASPPASAAARSALVDLPQDGAEGGQLRTAVRHHRLPRHRRHRRGLLPALGVVHTTWPAVPGPLQGLHLDAEAERLPLDPHHRGRAAAAAGRAADPHRGDAAGRRIRHRRPRALQGRCRPAHQRRTARSRQRRRQWSWRQRRRMHEDIQAYEWLRRTIEMLAEGDTPEEFLEHTKLELFQDQVFCFTPKGRLIALPRGATPIDFAYAVHTDIGDTCVGCQDQRPARCR